MARLKMLASGPAVVAARVAPPVKLADPFYETAAWRAFASAIKRQRGYRCQACGHDGRAQRWRMHADHIVERKDGGADFDPLNIQVLCHGCHNRKTAAARGERRSG